MTLRLKPTALVIALVAACASCGVADPLADQLVFNEVGATGDDFVELYNVTDAPLAVGGYAVTDSRSDGLPKLSRAVRFPAGASVPAHGYLVVAFEGSCPSAATPYLCVQAGVYGPGVSQSRGEALHLLDPDDQVISTVQYPREAAPTGWTWGRFANGTGNWEVTRRTPGTTNLE